MSFHIRSVESDELWKKMDAHLARNFASDPDGVATSGDLKTVKGEGMHVTADGPGLFMHPDRVRAIYNTVARESGLAAFLPHIPVSFTAGQAVKMSRSEMVFEAVDTETNPGVEPPTKPDLEQIAYACKEFKVQEILSYKSLREAGGQSAANYFEVWKQGLIEKMANDYLKILLQSDSSLSAAVGANKALTHFDGFLAQAQALAHDRYPVNLSTVGVSVGKAYDPSVYFEMEETMPEQYRDDKGMVWIENPSIPTVLKSKLANWQGSPPGGMQGSAGGDRAFYDSERETIIGKKQLVSSKMPRGLAGDAAAVAPTAVTDNTTYATVRVNSLLPDTTDHTGRKVKITFGATGGNEICTVYRNGSSQNVINTVGTLGQSSISTTASGYSIQLADTTPILLCNPRGLHVYYIPEIHSFREWQRNERRWVVTLFMEFVPKLIHPDAVVIQRGLVIPAAIGSGFN